MFLRAGPPFNYDTNEASDESGLECLDPSRTQQQFAEEVDINTILERFGIGYEIPQGVRVPAYQDFEESFDFQSSMNVLVEAERAFMAMPANVRSRFGNDPHLFMEFVNDPENLEDAVKLGLVIKQAEVKPPDPIDVRVIAEPSATT